MNEKIESIKIGRSSEWIRVGEMGVTEIIYLPYLNLYKTYKGDHKLFEEVNMSFVERVRYFQKI